MSLFESIVQFFAEHIFLEEYYGSFITNFYQIGYQEDIVNGELVGYKPFYMSLDTWLSYTCAIISIIFILVLCCLFVYKIVRLIGGLIR